MFNIVNPLLSVGGSHFGSKGHFVDSGSSPLLTPLVDLYPEDSGAPTGSNGCTYLPRHHVS